MNSVEVDKCFQGSARRLIPDLTQNAYVYRAHQLLAQDVKTVCYIASQLYVSA